jgi:hypothetical protein
LLIEVHCSSFPHFFACYRGGPTQCRHGRGDTNGGYAAAKLKKTRKDEENNVKEFAKESGDI